jgi:hypothetical protein
MPLLDYFRDFLSFAKDAANRLAPRNRKWRGYLLMHAIRAMCFAYAARRGIGPEQVMQTSMVYASKSKPVADAIGLLGAYRINSATIYGLSCKDLFEQLGLGH